MTDSVFDIALLKRFTDSDEIATIDVTSADTLLIHDSATGLIMKLPFSTVASAISAAFASSFAALVDGKVPSSQLPSYVDDVLEFANLAAFPATGETGKIYVSIATNLTYRWSGSTYVEIASSPGSTDVVSEGSTNLYFTNARARAAVSASGSLSYNSSTGVFSYSDSGKEPTIASGTTAQYWRGDKSWQTLPTSLPASDVYTWAKALTKPSYSKSEVGLSNVDNTADADKPVSTAQQTAIDAKQNSFNGIIKTASGVYASVPNNTDVLLTTLPNVTAGTWLVNLCLAAGSAVTWSSNYLVNTQDTTSSLIALLSASGGVSITMSGLNLMAKQTSGITFSITWSITRIA